MNLGIEKSPQYPVYSLPFKGTTQYSQTFKEVPQQKRINFPHDSIWE